MNIRHTKSLASLLLGMAALLNAGQSIAQEQANLFLFGQELEVCSSDMDRYCSPAKKQTGFDESAKLGPIFQVTDEAITRLSDFNWTEQPELRAQVIAMLQSLKPQIEASQLSEREFVRLIRRSTFTHQDKTIKGRDVWSGLFEFERNNLFDLLEQKQATRAGKRLKTQVDLMATDNESALLAYQAFYERADQVAGKKRKPRVALLTGVSRDPYQKVDYYTGLFEQLGFEVIWLPLDGAMQTALSVKEYDAEACSKLAQFQIQKLGSFRRNVLYPDLFKLQEAACRKDESILDSIKRADAIYIADGSNLLASHALNKPTGEPSPELLKIKEMLGNKQLIIAVEGQSINSLASRNTILSGEGAQVMIEPSNVYLSANEVCNLGVDCISTEAERELNYLSEGVLGLFPYGLIDTQLSSLARQTRLLKVAYDTQTQMSFGLDRKTALAISIEESDKGDSVTFDVIGSGGFWIFDIQDGKLSSNMATGEYISHYFTHQDKVVYRNASVAPDFAPWKIATRLNSSNPTVTSSQPFGRYNYFKFSQMLCNTGASSAIAIGQLQEINYTLQLVKSASSAARQGVILLDGDKESRCSFSGVTNQILIN